MYCKYCCKPVENDSIFCRHCGRKLVEKESRQYVSSFDKEARTIVINGERYTVRSDGVIFDEDGWDVGRAPSNY